MINWGKIYGVEAFMAQAVRNYAKELEGLEATLAQKGERPRLLLHVCCAPCASGVLEGVARFFQVALVFYNPNIGPREEYDRRLLELKRLVGEMPLESPVELLEAPYDGGAFEEAARGLEGEPEGGSRCLVCFRLRLGYTAKLAKERGFDYFTTTLSISPLKNARALNQIGEEMGRRYGVKHLPSDFKKRDGYKLSVQRSREYGLYRQDYCGCVYSKRERGAGESEK